MVKYILCTALAAVLLTGCADTQPAVPADTTALPVTTGTAVTAETTVTALSTTSAAVTETQDAGSPVQFVVVPATAGTFAPATTAPETQETAAASSVPDAYYDLQFGLPGNINLFAQGNSIPLAGTGIVHAKDGAPMYDKPSVSGKQLASLKDGTSVEILSAENTQDTEFDKYPTKIGTFRWFRVKADGKEGYVYADWIAAKFSQKIAELSQRQLFAVTTYLFYQGQQLFALFSEKGGFKGEGGEDTKYNNYFYDHDANRRYDPLLPSTLTLNDIYSEFYAYFSPKYHKDQLMPASADQPRYYAEKDGKLYVSTYFGTQIAPVLDYVLCSINHITETEIQGSIAMQTRYSSSVYDFTLVYEDGVWKIGEFTYYLE